MDIRKPYRWRVRVRFADTDASQRIHYTAMFRYFEAAEQEFLRDLGVAYSGEPFRNYGFPRVHVECDFLSPIHYDEALDIEVTVERVGSSSYTLAFGAYLASRLAAKGKITVVCLDKHTQRSIAIPDQLALVLRAHLA